MRLSRHFGRTLRDAPSEASMASHQLTLRAGLARPVAAGMWAYLPLGQRVIRRLKQLIRKELAAAGAEELLMPATLPAGVSQTAGHGATVLHLCQSDVESYKDLPRAVFQFQARAQDEPRAGGGLLRLRESLATDAYSLDRDEAGAEAAYQRALEACGRIFARCELPVVAVEAGVHPADAGPADGSPSHAFMLPHPHGDDRLVHCAACDYAASIEVAAFERGEALFGDPAPLDKVETPGCATIADLCAFLSIEPQQTLKLVIYTINLNQPGEAIVMALIRGDLDVSEAKLMSVLGVSQIEPATEDIIAEIGASAGYASPIGLQVRREGAGEGVVVIADESLRKMSNFVTGANDPGYHYANANYPRDFEVTVFADIAEPYDGASCLRCGGALSVERAIKLGHTSRLGARLSQAAGANYLDDKGQEQPIVMGTTSLSLDRLVAAVIEQHHDDHGILWPRAVAPYDVHIVAIAKDGQEAAVEVASQLADDLQAAGLAVLHDDRLLSPGVMFNDADLIGVPLRVTVGAKSLDQGGVEVKWRHEPERQIVPLDGAAQAIARLLAE